MCMQSTTTSTRKQPAADYDSSTTTSPVVKDHPTTTACNRNSKNINKQTSSNHDKDSINGSATSNRSKTYIPKSHIEVITQVYGEDCDLYEILGISRATSQRVIRAKYLQFGQKLLTAIEHDLSNYNNRVPQEERAELEAKTMAFDILSHFAWKRQYDETGLEIILEEQEEKDTSSSSCQDSHHHQEEEEEKEEKESILRAVEVEVIQVTLPQIQQHRSNRREEEKSDEGTSRRRQQQEQEQLEVRASYRIQIVEQDENDQEAKEEENEAILQEQKNNDQVEPQEKVYVSRKYPSSNTTDHLFQPSSSSSSSSSVCGSVRSRSSSHRSPSILRQRRSRGCSESSKNNSQQQQRHQLQVLRSCVSWNEDVEELVFNQSPEEMDFRKYKEPTKEEILALPDFNFEELEEEAKKADSVDLQKDTMLDRLEDRLNDGLQLKFQNSVVFLDSILGRTLERIDTLCLSK